MNPKYRGITGQNNVLFTNICWTKYYLICYFSRFYQCNFQLLEFKSCWSFDGCAVIDSSNRWMNRFLFSFSSDSVGLFPQKFSIHFTSITCVKYAINYTLNHPLPSGSVVEVASRCGGLGLNFRYGSGHFCSGLSTFLCVNLTAEK